MPCKKGQLPARPRLGYARCSFMEPERHTAGDPLTIVCVALAAYMVSNLLHEVVGHGGACLTVGGRPLAVSTVDMQCSVDHRLVTAGGTIVNLLAAALFCALGRAAGPRNVVWRYFFWIAMTLNMFGAAGYFAFSGVGGFGDWAVFIRGFEPAWAWRVGLALFGALAYLLAIRISLLELRPLIGSDRRGRYSRGVQLSRLPYFAGGTLACLAGALNPAGWILVALSAAASTFGGSSALLWMMELLRGGWIPPGSAPDPPPIPRSWGWIATAAIGACLWVALLGPGLKFGQA